MSNPTNLKPQDLARLALFQATGNPLFDVELERARSPRPHGARGYPFVIDGVTIEVSGYYSKAIPATQINPPDPAEFEITSIYIGNQEVTALLGNWCVTLFDHLAALALKENEP
jgi:hypothetical protein